MSMCQEHWTALKEKVEAAGLGHLIAPDGETAAAQFVSQMETETTNKLNFDPLMNAYWSILFNAGETLGHHFGAGVALYVITDGDGQDIEGLDKFPGKSEATKWPRCGLCYARVHHELTCVDPNCKASAAPLDYMLDRATQDVKDQAQELGLLEEAG